MTSESKTMLPCPFCGGAAKIKRNKTVMVSCTICQAATFQHLNDPSSAIAAWNQRTPSVETEIGLRTACAVLADCLYTLAKRCRLTEAERQALDAWDAVNKKDSGR